jgi:hypothetical protein
LNVVLFRWQTVPIHFQKFSLMNVTFGFSWHSRPLRTSERHSWPTPGLYKNPATFPLLSSPSIFSIMFRMITNPGFHTPLSAFLSPVAHAKWMHSSEN